jgi:hypothetical protein
MLQIISGKFFGEGKINEEQCDAILYSNFSWGCPVTIPVAELRPAAPGTRVSSYVLRYTNRYQPGPQDILVLPRLRRGRFCFGFKTQPRSISLCGLLP